MNWTTRMLPELTRRNGVEELHNVYFAPKGYVGKGATVSLGIPECELIFADLGPDGRPFAMVNQPKVNRNIRRWTLGFRTVVSFSSPRFSSLFASSSCVQPER